MPPQPPAAGGSVEETVEAIIDEKWNELVKDITTIIEWKNQAQNTIIGMEQQFRDLKEQFDKLHQALIAKIGEYDKNILDVGAEVKAMEKVFSKVLPVFTENVAELSEITKRMKG
jgi:predicted site-specific integrase-resolvase